MARSARAVPVLLATSLLTGGASTQSAPIPPPGFAAPVVVAEGPRAAAVRHVAFAAPDVYLVAIGGELELRRAGSLPRPILSLGAGGDFGFVLVDSANNRVMAGAVRSGKIAVVDLVTGAVVATFAGPPNAFDAVALGNGDVLLSANPLWPAPGASTGVWLAGPNRAPRELLPLLGPSGPLLLDGNGDLVVAELGPIVPPPPGVARVLRFPAWRLQQALLNGTMTVADASASGHGYLGIYDLAFDDLGRLHATDPASHFVVHCAPGGLSPVGTTLDVGAGMFALGLQFVAHAGAPFRGYQPPEHAPALLVARSDFASTFELLRLQPERPRLSIAPGPVLPPGPALLSVQDAPPLGIALLAASASGHVAEQIVITLAGVPLWLALPTGAPLAVMWLPLDAQGRASVAFTNPGGFAGFFDFQAAVLGAPGSFDLGSSRLLTVQLLP